jgi:hypothetical protein
VHPKDHIVHLTSVGEEGRERSVDVHKETVVACVRIVEGGEVSRSIRTFATTTASLIELGEWLTTARFGLIMCGRRTAVSSKKGELLESICGVTN